MRAGDLTTLANVKQWLGVSGLVIKAVSLGSPAQITLAGPPSTPLVSGLPYTIYGAVGTTQINGTWTITVVDPSNFTIATDTTASAPYVPGTGFVAVSDALLGRLITACSAYLQNWLNRNIANQDYVETRDGVNNTRMMTNQYPVTSVASVTVDGLNILARPPFGVNTSSTTFAYNGMGGPVGFVHDDSSVALSGYRFCRGYQNCVLSYAAGFLTVETQSVPEAPGPYTLTPLWQWSAGDRGVKYAATGVALTAVPSSPAQGQYTYADQVYTFNALDAGAAVLLSYAVVPYDIEQAAIDTIGDWFKYTSRIGVLSEAIEGQSITFVNSSMPARAKDVLMQYKRVHPMGS